MSNLFGQKLRILRKVRELSQHGLAGASGLTREYIARLESGQHDPSLTAVLALSRALEIGVDRLIEPSYKNKQKEAHVTKKEWNDEVESKINKIDAVVPWLKNIVEDDDKYFEWDSQKSAHQAMKYLELAMFEMWNLQYWQNKKQRDMWKKSTEDIADDTK